MRPRWRTVPELLNLSWIFVTQEQFDTFDEWYEDYLVAGSLDFDLPVQARGTDFEFQWYTAKFVKDYKSEVLDPFGYLVTGTVELIKDLGSVRIPPGIQATIGLPFTVTVETAPPPFAATINLNFVLTVETPQVSVVSSIELIFGLTWGSPPVPSASQERETEAGDSRETDVSDTRYTD